MVSTEASSKPLLGEIDDAISLARKEGSLETIHTEPGSITDDGITFLVRIGKAATRKPDLDPSKKSKPVLPKDRTGAIVNKSPFLPPFEPGLCVKSLGENHRLILNKYNVVPRHLLVCSRDYREQGDLLNVEDVETTFDILRGVDGLAFYNAGEHSGHSQRHFHLQVVPLDALAGLVNESNALSEGKIDDASTTRPQASGVLPIEAEVFSDSFPRDTFATLSIFSKILHTIFVFSKSNVTGKDIHDVYLKGLDHLGFSSSPTSATTNDSSYNLIFTSKWVLLVARSASDLRNESNPKLSIGINSLGYCGLLYAKNNDVLDFMKQVGPLKVLEALSLPSRVRNDTSRI